ncbi:hypothetical protein ACQUQP_13340 [Marinobacterium sp. YM272]|uniref:hypothetical protein n=1 Tax=Marinobacterium sp. YM272 TaxID=3421654 RepID=UPI003D7FBB41
MIGAVTGSRLVTTVRTLMVHGGRVTACVIGMTAHLRDAETLLSINMRDLVAMGSLDQRPQYQLGEQQQ